MADVLSCKAEEVRLPGASKPTTTQQIAASGAEYVSESA
jgi:hypothetical protein